MYDSVAGLRLSDRYTKVATSDFGEACPIIEQLHGAFVAHPRARGAAEDEPVYVRAASFGPVAISTFKFGRPIEIVPHGLAGSVLVTTALSGKAGLTVKGGIAGIPMGATFISQEEDNPTFLYDADTEVLKLRFDRGRLEEFCFKMYDRAPKCQLRFDYLMSLPEAENRWTSLLRFVVATLNSSGNRSPMELSSMEELLMLTLLSVQPSNFNVNSGRVGRVSPRQFKQAVEYINQHLDTDIRLSDMAVAACCSIRSLTRAFQMASDTTPMQYVHGLRLQRVRTELSHATVYGKTIADIAYHWGFRHLGEFNRKYREAFGETPSETRASR